jgi:hypothetical protein
MEAPTRFANPSCPSSAPEPVIGPAALTLIGRLFLECCTAASEMSNAPIEDAAKVRMARSLIRSFDRHQHDPEMMKRLALGDARLLSAACKER